MTQRRWIWIGVAAAIVVALVASFAIGRSTASDTVQEAPVATTTTTIPPYGHAASRDAYIVAVRGSLPSGATAADVDLLVAGDSLCADLEGFSNQGRDAHYAIRILWTDDLRYLDSEEMALFGVVLAAAPRYLCPQYVVLAEDVAYWLGI
jgi:hypothetical protein